MDNHSNLPKDITIFLIPPYKTKAPYSLASFSPKCMIIYTFLKFTNLINHKNLKLHFSIQTTMSPTGEFPFLSVGNEIKATTPNEIINFFAEYGYYLDHWLNKEQHRTVNLWQTLTVNTLEPIWNSLLYIDDLNYNEVSKTVFFSRMNNLLKYTQKEAVRNSLPRNSLSVSSQQAQNFFSLLSDQIPSQTQINSKKSYFFFEKLSTLDAYLFGYLSCFCYIKFPNGDIADILRNKFPNLALYTKNIYDLCETEIEFISSKETTKEKKEEKKVEQIEEIQNEENSNSRINRMILFGGFALLVSYSLLKSYGFISQ